jgi:hypothetical protein
VFEFSPKANPNFEGFRFEIINYWQRVSLIIVKSVISKFELNSALNHIFKTKNLIYLYK